MKKCFNIVFKLLVVLLMAICSFNHVKAEDADSSDKTSSIESIEVVVVDPVGDLPIDITTWSDVKFELHFEANPDGQHQINGGDYIIVKWPSENNAAITPHYNEVELKEDGQIYGVATITEEYVRVDFTDVVNTKYNIKGKVEISGRITKNNSLSEEDEEFYITIKGEAKKLFTVTPGDSIIGGDKEIRKYGEQVTEDDVSGILTWNIRINEPFDNDFVGDVTIVDNLKEGHQLIQEEIFLQEFRRIDDKVVTVGDFYSDLTDTVKELFIERIVEPTGYSFEDVENLPIAFVYYQDNEERHNWVNTGSKYFHFQNRDLNTFTPLSIDDYLGEGNFTITNKKLSLTIPDDKINNRFLQLVYYSEITDFSKEIFENDAEMRFKKNNSDKTHEEDAYEVKYNSSSGEITGLEYNSLRITKKDTEGDNVPGIYFKVTRKSDGHIWNLVSDERGICELFRLTAGEYEVVEMSEDEAKQIDPEATYPVNMVIDTTIYKVTIGTDEETTINNDLVIINTYDDEEKETTSISVNKVWDDNNNQSKKRPESILITLYDGDDKEIDSVYLSEDNKWNHTFTDLPLKDDNGNIIEYYCEETSVDYYSDELTRKDNVITFKNTNRPWFPKKVKDTKVGNFVLLKTVSGEARKDKKYRFNISFVYEDVETFNSDISINPDEEVIYTTIPTGTIITVKELEDGYTTTYKVNDKTTNIVTIEDKITSKMVVDNYLKKKDKKYDIPSTGIK